MGSLHRVTDGVAVAAGMPAFGLDGYRDLLHRFASAGYVSRCIGQLDEPDEPARVVYLRHDLDFLTNAALPFAHAEAELGFRATYYVLLTGPYNVFAPENRDALIQLAELGHEVGLHYDVEAFARANTDERAELDAHLRTLESVVGRRVTTISTHNPSSGGDDPFRTVPGLRHPHDPRDERELLYVSDSRRTWRDARLLACFDPSPPARVMFLTHPELWLAPDVTDPNEYLHRVLEEVGAPHASYFERDVPVLWGVEPSGHEVEELRFEFWDRSRVEQNIDTIEQLFTLFREVPWTREQILSDRPGKWEHTVVALSGGRIEGFSFNSLRDDFIYIHALFVDPKGRGRGLGAQIVQRLEQRADEYRLAGLQLRVAFTNIWALRLYLACGFQITDVEAEYHQLVLTKPSTPATTRG